VRTTVTLPELGENVASAEVTSVLVKAGDQVAPEQPLIEVETEKAAVEVPSTVAGTVLAVHVAAGATLVSGAAIVTVETAEAAAAAERPTVAPSRAPAAPAGDQAPGPAAKPPQPTRTEAPGPEIEPVTLVPASPGVRRLAREIGVDVTQVRPSSADGRLTSDDVKAHARAQLTGGVGSRPAGQPPLPDFSAWGEVSEEPMTTVRRLTAEHVARAWSMVPQVTHHDQADITHLEELRLKLGERMAAAGGRFTVTAIAVKVAAAALRRFPMLNASVDVGRQVVIFKRYVHVGVAVDTEHGLLVPVIRDADRKSVTEIAVELDDKATRARERKLMPDEMQGASFTVTNLGGIGGTAFTPIVSWPQVAILGLSRARVEAAWVDGAWTPRRVLPLSLSYDHRLVDGADAARFVRWVAETLEQPFLLVLAG